MLRLRSTATTASNIGQNQNRTPERRFTARAPTGHAPKKQQQPVAIRNISFEQLVQSKLTIIEAQLASIIDHITFDEDTDEEDFTAFPPENKKRKWQEDSDSTKATNVPVQPIESKLPQASGAPITMALD